MTDTIKDLQQSAPLAATLTTLYTVPAATTASVGSITVCNQSATPTAFRIAISPAGAAIANQHYIAYDVPIGGNGVYVRTAGDTLATGTIVRVYATLATLSFSLSLIEVT